jgi:UDP:flavonoid glycosyltransferase YjiC (YdhE family)
MIHHGGHGFTLTALAAGTPALIIPTYSERESNARHAAALGAALYLVPEIEGGDAQHEPELALVPEMGGAGKLLEPKLVAGAIGTLLEDPRYSNSARAAAQQLAKLPGAVGAANVIEALPRSTT